MGFDCFKKQYPTNNDFQDIWYKCLYHEATNDYHIQAEFLFKGLQLCVP